MKREIQQNGAQAEYLSPWSSGHGWSFNPQKISVVSPRPTSSQDYSSSRTSSKHKNGHPISMTQIVTLSLVVLSLGLLAAITALLMG